MNDNCLTERQGFRIAILENIALPMMLIPYVTVRAAGDKHIIAMVIGVIIAFIYVLLLYSYSRMLPMGIDREAYLAPGVMGNVINIIYPVRFTLRAATISLFFAEVVRRFLLINSSKYIILCSFVLICIYGASLSTNKRGRLMELLFLWVIVPLILTAVFSVNSLSLDSFRISINESNTVIKDVSLYGGVAGGAYSVWIVLSSLELLLFSFSNIKNISRCDAIRVNIWIGCTILLSYFYIIGILGAGFAGSSSFAAFNVMEAATFPGSAVNRMDYLILVFFSIGIFATVSGYIFWSKSCLMRLNCFVRRADKGYVYIVIGLMLMAGMIALNTPGIGRVLVSYIYKADVFVGIVLPLMVIAGRRARGRGINEY